MARMATLRREGRGMSLSILSLSVSVSLPVLLCQIDRGESAQLPTPGASEIVILGPAAQVGQRTQKKCQRIAHARLFNSTIVIITVLHRLDSRMHSFGHHQFFPESQMPIFLQRRQNPKDVAEALPDQPICRASPFSAFRARLSPIRIFETHGQRRTSVSCVNLSCSNQTYAHYVP
jgi:hypothetical protein